MARTITSPRRRALLGCALLTWLCAGASGAQDGWWRLGGAGGIPWSEVANFTVMADTESLPGVLQPWVLKPDENFLPKLGPWQRNRFPTDPDFREGHPHLWIDTGVVSRNLQDDISVFVDDDIGTYIEQRGDFHTFLASYYTLDFGNAVPLERFVAIPPEGVNADNGEPFRPNYVLKTFSLTGSLDDTGMLTHELDRDFTWRGEGPCCPLETLLAARERSSADTTVVEFTRQSVRYLRLIPFPDGFDANGNPVTLRTAVAELQAYGRGVVPRAVWESQVISMGRAVNFGRVVFAASQWRLDGDEAVRVEDAPADISIEIRTGRDPTPEAYFGFDDLGGFVEVTKSRWDRLIPLEIAGSTTAVGFRGPVAEDQENWSFWSTPLQQSSVHPRVPWGEFLQLRIVMETASPQTFVRLDSLWVETGPLLADRVAGEIVAADDLQPDGGRVVVEAGTLTDFVLELGADFAEGSRTGFDALRLVAPAEASLTRLVIGDQTESAVPDSVVPEASGFVVYLPQRIDPGQPDRVRLHLRSSLFGEAGQFSGEVFDRAEPTLLQQVEGGDVSPDLGSDQLLIVASATSESGVVADVEAGKGAFSPQGDGVNDVLPIRYTLFRLLHDSVVRIEVYRLDGTRVWHLRRDNQRSGSHTVEWTGRDDAGQVVAPGLYVVRVEVETDSGRQSRMRPFAVVY